MRMLCAMAALVAMAGCTTEGPSRKALESAGFSKIELKGWSAFACSEDDTFRTKFEATNPAGARVAGVVCCGWWKNCTIRF
jgi:hypothetical protein